MSSEFFTCDCCEKRCPVEEEHIDRAIEEDPDAARVCKACAAGLIQMLCCGGSGSDFSM
jgi:hypothetical protein